MIKRNIAKLLAFVFTIGTVYSVNSACILTFGQEEEPNSLKRFKKF